MRGVPGGAQRRAAVRRAGAAGVAVGAATGALGAALIDLQPEGSGLAPLITTAAPLRSFAAPPGTGGWVPGQREDSWSVSAIAPSGSMMAPSLPPRRIPRSAP